ncbi:N-terminal nucleophile aminohydrolase [Ramaria rubella]|nr:N-terminal nucleophile aminohydrolase [Ramaria rubella]
MCRWFAYISPSEPTLLEDILVTPKHSLAKQVHEHFLPKLFAHNLESPERTTEAEIASRNFFHNIDGLGVVWYSSTRYEFVAPDNADYGAYPVAYKTLSQPLSDPNFLSIAAHTSTNVCFGHIRAAVPSPEHPIPVLSQYNCHPFIRGRFTLMHNGYVSHFSNVRREIFALVSDEEAGWMKGNTDSEALAAIFYTFLGQESGEGNDVVHIAPGTVDLAILKKALMRTFQAIIDVQKRVMKGKPLLPNDLNVAITDGKLLLCSRFRNHKTEQPPSLYFSTTAGVTYNRKFPGHPDGPHTTYGDGVGRCPEKKQEDKIAPTDHGRHVIVASEPTTCKSEEWELVGKNECVMVDNNGVLVTEPLSISF